MNEAIKNTVEGLLKDRDTSPVCIVLDWLSLYFKHANLFKSSYEEGDQIVINEDCYLLEINRPTLHFNTHFVLFYKKEECAHLLLNSKNELFFKADVVKVEFSNHTLYSQEWVEVYNILLNYGLIYHAASRIDIAIDGVNYLHQLLNIYAKQTVRNKTVCLKNSTESRARFSAKVLNAKTMLFENFNIGAAGGNKMITVYNKSLELVKSGKKYIQEYWLKNGIITQAADLDALGKELKVLEKRGHETFHLKGVKNIYRFELRLKSESIKEIKNFSVEMLFDGAGLASIVKTHCRKYFDAYINDNPNVTHCTSFDLLPYERLSAKLINKVQRVEKDGLYKAKLTIHGLIQDTYKGYIKNESYNEIIETIMDRVMRYRLSEYLADKLPQWHEKYHKFTDNDRINDVTIIMNRIEQLNSELIESSDMLAERHNQAAATAQFGE